MEEEMGNTGDGGNEKDVGELETARGATGKEMKCAGDVCK
jgi:hypothetical protein